MGLKVRNRPRRLPSYRVRLLSVWSIAIALILSTAPLSTATSSPGNPFPSGYCTWGAWNLAPWLGNKVSGNAGEWYASAQGKLPTGTTPVVGAVFVSNNGGIGHVGVVTKIISSTRFIANEMNGGSGGTAANQWRTTEFKKYREHEHSTGPSMKFIYKPGTEPGALNKYIGHIVQWSGDKKTQKTAWLVGADLHRRWIPDIATYSCLKAKGAPGPDVLAAATLDKLPDLTGVRATCTPPSPSTPPKPSAPSTAPTPTQHIYHVHNTCADHSCGLLVETAPGSHYGGVVIGSLKDGTAVNIRCQTVGGMITGGEGSNDVWDQIDFAGGVGYVADLYMDTPGNVKAQSHRYFTSSIPRC